MKIENAKKRNLLTTLFGLLAMEIAIVPDFVKIGPFIGGVFLLVALVFVWRSFYKMRIPK